MFRYVCSRCCASITRPLQDQQRQFSPSLYGVSEATQNVALRQAERVASSHENPVDIAAILSRPVWSVRSLLPDASSDPSPAREITEEDLHKLHRLSALPLPKSPEKLWSMAETLQTQIHLVKNVQKVDTEGVEPLQSIRDETEEGIAEVTVGLDDLSEAFAKEDFVGRNRRPRRIRERAVDTTRVENWDALGTASETIKTPAGRFFVVRSGKD